MTEQIYWEDVTEGMELPALVKEPTTRQLVQYAGASGDFYEIHYDKDFAQGTGLTGVIIHGALKNAWLGQLMTDWAGPQGILKKLSCQYRGMDYPGEPITAKGLSLAPTGRMVKTWWIVTSGWKTPAAMSPRLEPPPWPCHPGAADRATDNQTREEPR